ncbi:MAG: hypothetical protein D6B28_03115 [Gammaproteobacteria bacterium]|nr:MAG: hypothetical protein D6B28_03115 [Gammaproteobacteria bacterium]
MDMIFEIKRKISEALPADFFPGIYTVVSHLQMAEHYWQEAKGSIEEYLFTDAVLRANHAFEAALGEAYKLVCGKDPENLTVKQLYKYLDDQNVFKDKEAQTFHRYLEDWEIPAETDEQLFYSEQEAMLAILNVSAFFFILVEQIIELASYEKAKYFLGWDRTEKIRQEIERYGDGDKFLLDKIVALFRLFSADLFYIEERENAPAEYEMLGYLRGFLEVSVPELEVEIDKRVELGASHTHLDMLISLNETTVLIETKRSNQIKGSIFDIDNAISQLSGYMTAIKKNKAVLFYLPILGSSDLATRNIEMEVDGVLQQIKVIYPQ